jgi:hypothetical protein
MTARAADARALTLRGICAIVLLACAALASPAASHAQATGEAQTNERSVMAAYIYRFITYVEWPVSAFASPEAPIVIGVVNADDIAGELEQIVQGRTAQGRRLLVRKLAPGDALTGINVLFVGGDGAQRALQAAKLLTGRPVLTITGVERGMDHGSVINFVHVDGRVRFEVNVVAAEKSGLRLSSRLLTVATRIKAN